MWTRSPTASSASSTVTTAGAVTLPFGAPAKLPELRRVGMEIMRTNATIKDHIENAEKNGWELSRKRESDANKMLADNGMTVHAPDAGLMAAMNKIGDTISAEWLKAGAGDEIGVQVGLSEIRLRVAQGDRVLVTTLTKRLAEDLSGYFRDAGLRCKWQPDAATLDEAGLPAQLTMPVLLVHGSEDDVVPTQLSERFHRGIPHADKDPKVAGVKAGCNGCHAPISFLAGDTPPP